MMMNCLPRIDYLTRADFAAFKPALPPGPENPGGGMAEKTESVRRALADVHITDEPLACQGWLTLIEPLWITGGDTQKNLKRLDTLTSSFRVLWTSDLEWMRWTPKLRDAVLSRVHVVACESEYQLSLMQEARVNARLLTNPLDTDFYLPQPKQPQQIVAISHVAKHKHIETVLEVYRQLPAEMTKIYVGGVNLWGNFYNQDFELEREVEAVCDVVFPNASRREVAAILGTSMAYLADTRYDTFCYGHTQAMSCGCVCFVGGHPLFSQAGRPGYRFVAQSPAQPTLQVEEVVAQITEAFDDVDALLKRGAEEREFAIERYGFPVFREQLKRIVTESLIV